ncbi:MAG: FKBP-type peptidyl-prolyl cis-trans isomerase FkpA [Flavobacteriales bacterium]|jgi:FKBP-type peptidyl-prolyl cis-trans isomerase FklB
MILKYTTLVLSAGLILVGCKSNETVNANSGSLSTPKDSISYALGVSIGENLKTQGIEDIDENMLAQGMRAQLNGDSLFPLDEADIYIRAELEKRKAMQEIEAKQGGIDFLTENESKEGVQVTESGLQYKILTEGEGAYPVAADEVTVNYEGRLVDGTIFDSSYKRGTPATFGLSQVIPGWTEGLQLLQPGGKVELYIPQELGYGSRNAPGGTIPPYSTLIFVVELLEITPTN